MPGCRRVMPRRWILIANGNHEQRAGYQRLAATSLIGPVQALVTLCVNGIPHVNLHFLRYAAACTAAYFDNKTDSACTLLATAL